jgi:hypothetical protein
MVCRTSALKQILETRPSLRSTFDLELGFWPRQRGSSSPPHNEIVVKLPVQPKTAPMLFGGGSGIPIITATNKRRLLIPTVPAM